MSRRRETVARHAVLKQPRQWPRFVTILAAALVAVLLAGVGVAAVRLLQTFTGLGRDAVQLSGQPAAPPGIGAYPGAFNMLVIGTDECDPSIAQMIGEERCSGDEAEGHLNDVNLLVHVSAAPRRVTVVSFPRDLIVEMPTCTDESGNETSGTDQINTAYKKGGLRCAADTIALLTGQEVSFAAKFSFLDVMAMTDAVGGVQVCLAKPMYDPTTGIDWPAGDREVSGFWALQFLRTRAGVGDGSDLARISNQQQYMSSLVKKLTSNDVLRDPVALDKLAAIAADNMIVDSALAQPQRLFQLAYTIKDVPTSEYRFLKYPTYDDPNDPNRQRPSLADAQVMWDAMNANVEAEITGTAGANNGVELKPTPGATTTPDAPAETTPEDPSTSPAETTGPSPSPTDKVALPESITGSTAAQTTCSTSN